ncbi:thiolase family protein [Microtetraspora sp. NBRC 16547]|uniref:thiolase family protein n=1 Tax=Microtetraspora sp. NBRC 16547 TaxID=3030993 RepID=UPI0024A4771E|nr:thiolase family protein [Microtetraspora sp. NBRC 16547]GLW99340.1 acetyl-CoA acyltransferase [Microtetraspora sp. NBRC 16547]
MKRDAVIAAAVRTPIGRRNGSLSAIHPADLTAHVLNAVLHETGLEPDVVEDVMWGCVTQIGDQSSNVGRMGLLAAGWPVRIPAMTVDRACGSSQQALHLAVATVLSGMQDLVVAGGVESMSRVPLGSARAVGEPYGKTALDRFGVPEFSQGTGAELMAERWQLSRSELDEFAARSHELSTRAWDAGAFTAQTVPVPTPGGSVTRDEGIRPGTTVETLAGLRPVFRPDGVIHAGNASQISDGAAALIVTTSERAHQLGLTPLARFHTGVVVGDDPVMMLGAPIPATELALRRSGLSIDDLGAYEVNEAFAPVPLAWLRETGADMSRLNPLGGAIAVGHPLGASGAILVTRLVHHLRDQGLRFGLVTMCEAGGMANATVLECLR